MASHDEIVSFIVERVLARSAKARGSELNKTKSLVAAGLIDSFSFLELVTEVEERFRVQLDLGAYDFEEVSTVEGLCGAVLAAT